MAEYSFPFASIDSDRVYSAEDWRRYFSKFITNGVFPVGAQLQTTAGSGMTVVVSAGAGWIDGAGYGNDSNLVLAIDPADGILNRIDRIVLRWSRAGRAIHLGVIKGTPASAPTPAALTRDADYYDLCIAQVTVNAGIPAIEAAHISDKRLDPALCGIVSSLITPDTSGWYDAWDTEYVAWLTSKQTGFDDWFAALQAVLSGDVAANLAAEILNLQNTKADKLQSLTGTLLSTGWVGAAAPYTQTISMAGVTTTTKGVVGLPESATSAEVEAAVTAMLRLTDKAADEITITAIREKPEINIPVELLLVG